MKVIVKEPGKAPVVEEIDGSLESMQKIVGGYIEHLGIGQNIGILVNEEGKLLGMEKNFYLDKYNDTIVGPAIFVREDGEEFTDIVAENIDFIFDQMLHAANGIDCPWK